MVATSCVDNDNDGISGLHHTWDTSRHFPSIQFVHQWNVNITGNRRFRQDTVTSSVREVRYDMVEWRQWRVDVLVVEGRCIGGIGGTRYWRVDVLEVDVVVPQVSLNHWT